MLIWNWLSSNATNIIAICALVTTFLHAYISRRHNRLSVKPHLEIARRFSFKEQEFYIKILNNGIGPALLTKTKLLVDDVEVNVKKSEALRNVISELFHLYKYNQHYTIISDSYMMKPNDEMILMKVELLDSLNTFPVTSTDEMEQLDSRIRVAISYESMYGEKFECT